MSSSFRYLFTIQEQNESPAALVLLLNYTLVFLVIGFFSYYAFSVTSYNFDFSAVFAYKEKFLRGFYITVALSIFSLSLSVILGLIFTYFKMSKFIILRCFANIYIEIIRGTPLLVQILLFYYIFANSLGFSNRYVVGVCILAFFNAAYLCEIFRASITSIPKIQYESAKTLGFSEFEIQRYVIIPQALKRTLPPLTNQFAGIIKDSSLLSVISISELTMSASEINSYTFSTLEAYIPLAVAYLCITLPISMISKYLEKRLI